MSFVVYAWPRGFSIKEVREELEKLIGSEEFEDQKTVPIPKQIAAMIGELYCFKITDQGYYELKKGFLGQKPFLDWPLESPFDAEESIVDLTWESRIWPPLKTLEDLIGLKLRRIPDDTPTKDIVPDRVTFYVDDEGRIKGFDQG